MNNAKKKIMAIAAAAASAAVAIGCSTPKSVTFDVERPWHDSTASYERLGYTAAVYDETTGTRVKIADGTLSFELSETVQTTTLDMSFKVTYTDDAPERDRGKTDEINSSVTFMTDSLVTSTMEKSVVLAPRDGVKNLSYTLEADYLDAHKATRVMTGGDEPITQTMTIPSGNYYDNEAMFFLARATAIGDSATTYFDMSNLFDSFEKGKFTSYSMEAAGKGAVTLDIGEWVKDFGVEGAPMDGGGTAYPIECMHVAVGLSSRYGQPYYVDYTQNPFKSGEKEHKKIPLKMSFSEYNGSTLVRVTEYTLSSCSFVKSAE